FPEPPGAMFAPAGGSPLENLTAACQVIEIYFGDANRPSDSTMLDTVKPDVVKPSAAVDDFHAHAIATAITLFTNSQPQTTYAGPWNEDTIPPLTLSGAVT